MDAWELDTEQVEPRAPRVLRSDDDAVRTVLIALPQGESLSDHQVHEHALLVVLDGEVTVRAGDEERRLGRHGLVHFDIAERHEVEAVSDARLLLLLAPWPGPGHPRRSA